MRANLKLDRSFHREIPKMNGAKVHHPRFPYPTYDDLRGGLPQPIFVETPGARLFRQPRRRGRGVQASRGEIGEFGGSLSLNQGPGNGILSGSSGPPPGFAGFTSAEATLLLSLPQVVVAPSSLGFRELPVVTPVVASINAHHSNADVCNGGRADDTARAVSVGVPVGFGVSGRGRRGSRKVVTAPTTAGVGPTVATAFDFNIGPVTDANRSSLTPPLAVCTMESNQDDLALQEAAAREWEPVFTGDIVGEKLSTQVIAEEYEKADPIYVQKTIVLARTYSGYRRVVGDGNCGWRAIAYAYCEGLVNHGTKALVDTELDRLRKLNDYISSVGNIDPFVFEDMTDETFELLAKIAEQFDNPSAALLAISEAFNDSNVSNAVIYHMRLLASSYLKANADEYAGFMTLDTGIKGYCDTVIERHGIEIEHLGITCLANILLKPAGFTLEVAYLDRSPGDQVNTYLFPDEANSKDRATLGPILHLLYRPNHYDILYRTPIEIQVNRVSFAQYNMVGTTPNLEHYAAMDLSTLSLIPGFGAPGPEEIAVGAGTALPIADNSLAMGPALSRDPTSSLVSYAEPEQQFQWMPEINAPEFAAVAEMQREETLLASPEQQLLESDEFAIQLETDEMLQQQQQQPKLRFVEYCQRPECLHLDNDAWREASKCVTTPFKNSHFSQAHFLNPHFQPEEYKPNTGDSGEVRLYPGTRKRSSS